MARSPMGRYELPSSDTAQPRIVELLGREGYDAAQIRKVPQRWEPATERRAK